MIFVLAITAAAAPADGWSRPAPVCSPEADGAAGAKGRGSIAGSSRQDRICSMLLLVQAPGWSRGFGKWLCLPAKAKRGPWAAPSEVVLLVLKI